MIRHRGLGMEELRVRKSREPNDQRLTVFLPERAVIGRVIRFTHTGMDAYVDAEVPRDERFSFSLHLQGALVSGEVTAVAQDANQCRLQFTVLTAHDRARLEPMMEDDW
jgi:hypothetical protein